MSSHGSSLVLTLECEEGTQSAELDRTPGEQLTSDVTSATPGVVIGTLTGLSKVGQPFVCFQQDAGEVGHAVGRTIVPLHATDIGRRAVLQFERGDSTKPIVLGLLRDEDDVSPHTEPPDRPVAEWEGHRMLVVADTELVLRCGEASITLTRAGKVIIRGAYVVSRSSGVNKVKGASVQIN